MLLVRDGNLLASIQYSSSDWFECDVMVFNMLHMFGNMMCSYYYFSSFYLHLEFLGGV